MVTTNTNKSNTTVPNAKTLKAMHMVRLLQPSHLVHLNPRGRGGGAQADGWVRLQCILSFLVTSTAEAHMHRQRSGVGGVRRRVIKAASMTCKGQAETHMLDLTQAQLSTDVRPPLCSRSGVLQQPSRPSYHSGPAALAGPSLLQWPHFCQPLLPASCHPVEPGPPAE